MTFFPSKYCDFSPSQARCFLYSYPVELLMVTRYYDCINTLNRLLPILKDLNVLAFDFFDKRVTDLNPRPSFSMNSSILRAGENLVSEVPPRKDNPRSAKLQPDGFMFRNRIALMIFSMNSCVAASLMFLASRVI